MQNTYIEKHHTSIFCGHTLWFLIIIKEDVAHIYNGIPPSHIRLWNNVTSSHTDGPTGCHTE